MDQPVSDPQQQAENGMEMDHDFAFLRDHESREVRCKGDTATYETTGKGTVLQKGTGREYELCEREVERQSGCTIFMAYIDFGPAYLPIIGSERVEVITPTPPSKRDEARMCKEIEDGTLLPTREEFFRALSIFHGIKPFEKLMDFCYEHGLYEVLTKEYIEALATYLEERIRLLKERTGKDVTILEVGAGDGRLTHFLQKELKRRGVTGYRMIASDGGQWHIAPRYPVEREDAATAVWDFEPQIVLACWMPKHEDWTAQMRATPSVEEYLLVGPKDSGTSGDSTATWGQELKGGEQPAYEQDGFQRQDLKDLSALQMGQKDRTGYHYSSTVSFRRKKNGTK